MTNLIEKTLIKFFKTDLSFRNLLLNFIRVLNIGPYKLRLLIGAVDRPHYAYSIYHSAQLAKKLGYKKISVIEFGVAGGSGIVNIEYHVKRIEKILNIDIEIYGFDTGEGLPKPKDYRDLIYHWKMGFFKMNYQALFKKLKRSSIIFGNIKDTIGSFQKKYNPAPIGAIFFDMDFYSSTMDSLKIFNSDEMLLPRIFCVFDDVLGSEIELYNDYTGERLAIREFNTKNKFKKISEGYHLTSRPIQYSWFKQMFIFHSFKHPQYNTFISREDQQISVI